jgi:hypothetical protein
LAAITKLLDAARGRLYKKVIKVNYKQLVETSSNRKRVFNYKLVIKKVIKSFIQPAPGLLLARAFTRQAVRALDLQVNRLQ